MKDLVILCITLLFLIIFSVLSRIAINTVWRMRIKIGDECYFINIGYGKSYCIIKDINGDKVRVEQYSDYCRSSKWIDKRYLYKV